MPHNDTTFWTRKYLLSSGHLFTYTSTLEVKVMIAVKKSKFQQVIVEKPLKCKRSRKGFLQSPFFRKAETLAMMMVKNACSKNIQMC